MTKEIIIVLLLIALIYYYRQSQKPLTFTGASSKNELQTQLDQIRNKLGSRTLDELLEENSDWETEVDTLTRSKNSLEQDLTAQAEAFQARLREKDREVKKFKEDLKALETVRGQLTSEKQQHKGSLERIKLLTEQITSLEQQLNRPKSPMPGDFPTKQAESSQDQLRKINLLFDEKAKDYERIEFEDLYKLLESVAQKERGRLEMERAAEELRNININLERDEKTKDQPPPTRGTNYRGRGRGRGRGK